MEASIAPPEPRTPPPGQNAMAGITQWWATQPANAQLGWVLALAVGLALMVFLAVRMNQPEMANVYSGLTPEDASQIASVLDARGIRYELNPTGNAIMVPVQEQAAARIAVAGEGVLPSGPAGYEILDNPNPFSLSDFTQRINLQRAREGELARTLLTLDDVKDARVMLTIPEDSPFLSEKEAPGASVALTLRGGSKSLDPTEAQTIANLIAASVPGLDPDRVVIVDQHANLLAGPSAQPGLLYDSEGESVVEQFEKRLAEKVLTLLEATYGPGNARVSVSADLDLDRVSSTKETYVPEPTGKGIPRSEETTDETTKNAPASEEGIAGTASNIPSYPTPDSAAGESSTKKNTSLTNYEISVIQEMIEKAPGTVKRLSVSVLIDQAEELEPAKKTQIQNMIQAAVLFDQTRGDLIEVLALPFSTAAEEAVQADLAQARQEQMLATGLQVGGWLLVLGLFVWGTLQIVKVLQVQPGQSAAGGMGDLAPAGGGKLRYTVPGGAAAGSRQGPLEIEIERPQLSPEEQAKQKIREEIMEIAKEHPDEAARVIRSWLRE